MSLDANHLLAGLGTGLCGGLLSGLFGVGGGVVMVPLLGLVLHLDQHRAQGATLAAMLLPTGLPAVLQYRSRGIHTSLRLVGVLVLAFLFGIYGGSVAAILSPRNRCAGATRPSWCSSPSRRSSGTSPRPWTGRWSLSTCLQVCGPPGCPSACSPGWYRGSRAWAVRWW